MNKEIKTYLIGILLLIAIASGLYIAYDKSYPELQPTLNSLLMQAPKQKEEFNGKAVDGHLVNIDYVGKIDGKAFEGGSAKGAEIVLGSKTFIDNFEEQLMNHKKGDTVDVKVTFPKNYQVEELQNKPAIFTVKINGVYKELPNRLNDSFVKSLGIEGITTVKELKDYIKQLIDQQRVQNNSNYSTDQNVQEEAGQ